MKAVVQRVSKAKVTVDGKVVGKIARGFVVLLGVGHNDTEDDARTLAKKIAGLRVFEDSDGKMNVGLDQIGGEMLIVSQFTLHGDCRKGRRPSFVGAAPPEKANALYERFVQLVAEQGITTATGIFQAMMQVELTNDGPVTLLLDTEEWKK